jgi:hypothetical protein
LNLESNSLTGTWSGDLKLSTCAPGLAGKIQLLKITEPTLLSDNHPSESPEPTKDHLLTALKERIISKNQFALIIGNNSYPSADIESLVFAKQNASDLKQTLVSQYNYADTNVFLLHDASRSEIIAGFEQIMAASNEHSQVLIFYAGHGYWDKSLQQGYWIPSDANLNSHSNWISNSTIKDYIRGIKSKHTLVISDACFSGALFQSRSFGNLKGETAIELYNLQSRRAITSGTMTTVPDESVFMKHLLYTLSNNSSIVLSAEELFSSIKFQVVQDSPNGQIPQYAPISQTKDAGGSFMFVR